MNSFSMSEVKDAVQDWIETRSAEKTFFTEIRPSFEEASELLRSMEM